jgi:hypothetical protein
VRFVDVDSRPVCRATIGLVVSHFNLHLLALARQRLNVAELYQMIGVVEGISPGATLPKLEAMYALAATWHREVSQGFFDVSRYRSVNGEGAANRFAALPWITTRIQPLRIGKLILKTYLAGLCLLILAS